MPAVVFDIVVPTVGRPSLHRLLQALDRGDGPRPQRIVLVDDRDDRSDPLLPTGPPSGIADLVRVLPCPASGPATARNLGWRACSAPWVAFLDDDVRPTARWLERLADDLTGAGRDVAGLQGRVRVPLAPGRAPTDWERNVAGLAEARWVTADMAYRRGVLEQVGGFDEHFPRAYREDVELGLRVTRAGYRIVQGQRVVDHPVPPADPWISVRKQAGNADDALMRALHGPRWRHRAGAPLGRRPLHLATTAAGGGAVLAA
ncbi:MAG: glycosyltransferase, partial [Actinomycetota bacterium]|nr:glycosyltransferase [Actinomycetota bacterium]